MEAKDDHTSVVYDIEAGNELRFTVYEENSNVSVKLLSGFAEIFGSELVKDEMYTFWQPASVVLFSWQGCSVELHGKASNIYMEDQSLMIIPTFMHACLEERRIRAVAENSRGPISLVIGERDVGKSSFCRILLNYAARLGRQPLYVDLSADPNSVTLPGIMGIVPVKKPFKVNEELNLEDMSAYPFGYASPKHNLHLYFLLIKEIGKKLIFRLKDSDPNTLSSGVIIDTFGWIWDNGYTMNKLAASAFEVDIIFIFSNENLYKKLKKDISPTVELVFVPAQSGDHGRSAKEFSRNHCSRIRNYFYGIKGSLKPFELNLSFNKIEIYKISPAPDSNKDYRNVSFDEVDLVKVRFGKNLIDQVLCVSYSNVPDKNLVISNVAGFVCVINVCLARKYITVLSPKPYPLSSKVLLMGNVRLKNIIK